MSQVECYIDASWSSPCSKVSVAFIIYEGKVKVFEFCKIYDKKDGVTEEQLTLLPLLSELLKYKKIYKKIIIYTDNPSIGSIFSKFKKATNENDFNNRYHKLCYLQYDVLRKSDISIDIIQVPRAMNYEADELAKNNLDNYIIKNYPNGVMQYALDDLSYLKQKWKRLFEKSIEFDKMNEIIEMSIEKLRSELQDMVLK